MKLLIIIPILTVAFIYLGLLGGQRAGPGRLTGARVALLQTALITGVLVAVQSELLSLFRALAQPYVTIAWLVALMLAVGICARMKLTGAGWKRFILGLRSVDRFSALVLAGFSLIAVLLLVVAVMSPANNMDSLLYHMSRVMHWTQDRSLVHYPVAFEVQLTHPILAEASILQLRLFWGSDQLASIPQWASLVLCAVAVSVGAKLLGAGRKGQLAAAAFAISIPIGLMEATSTQNDYVAGLWLTILAVFVLYACKEEAGWGEILSIAAALGLGLLTKGTFYPYAVAWGVWLIAHWTRQKRPVMLVKRGLAIVGVVVVLNAGYWMRNMVTYGTPLGPSAWVSDMSSARSGTGSIASNLTKYTLLNLVTPNPRINQAMVSFVEATFKATDPEASGFVLNWRWNNEDSAGSPIHLGLIGVVILALIALYASKRSLDSRILWYSVCAVGSFVIFVAAAHYDDYGVRFELPLILIWAPVLGSVTRQVSERRVAPLAISAFFIISVPYLLFNTTRPLIAMKNQPEPYAIHPLPAMGETKSSSIFYADQRTLLFINAPDLNQPMMEATHDIRDSGCKAVGLQIDSHDVEYPIWWLLKAPQSGVRIETIYSSEGLARYADPGFKPCAIICTICSGRTRLHGLDLAGSYDGLVNVYTGGSYSPFEDK